MDGTLTVNKAATSTVLVTSLAPASYGQSLTLTATVSASAGAPTGNVQFFDGVNLLGTVTLNNGSASFVIASLAASNHTLTAVYAGDERFASSTSATTTQIINQAVSS